MYRYFRKVDPEEVFRGISGRSVYSTSTKISIRIAGSFLAWITGEKHGKASGEKKIISD